MEEEEEEEEGWKKIIKWANSRLHTSLGNDGEARKR